MPFSILVNVYSDLQMRRKKMEKSSLSIIFLSHPRSNPSQILVALNGMKIPRWDSDTEKGHKGKPH